MRKAVAVPYIIALILGVAVIGLVGYWFATTGGKFGGQSAKTVCDNKFLQYCITKNQDKSYSDFTTETQECLGVDSSYTTCSQLTSVSGSRSGTIGQEGEQEGRQLAQCKTQNTQCGQGSQNPTVACCTSLTCKLEQSSQILKCLP